MVENLEFRLYILCTGMCVKEGIPGWWRSCKRLREEELKKILEAPKGAAQVERCVYRGNGEWGDDVFKTLTPPLSQTLYGADQVFSPPRLSTGFFTES